MDTNQAKSATTADMTTLLSTHPLDLTPYELLYKHLHAHPELSNQEAETATTVASQLAQHAGFQIHRGIGGHGLAAVLPNGPGPTILLRSDLDALPIREETGLPYASTVRQMGEDGEARPVMHACGHDMHMTCLLGAASLLHSLRSHWTGTLIVVFQPAEERGTGAKAMVEDGLYERVPVPDVVLGQHVMPFRAGSVGVCPGTIMAAADSYRVTMYGRGGHGSQPQRCVDPVVMAAALVGRLQGIVSREVDPRENAVVTVGSLRAGSAENVIVDRAELGIDIRSVDRRTRGRIVGSIERMVRAEALASNAPREPEMRQTRTFPMTDNDADYTARLSEQFGEYFGAGRFDGNCRPVNVSEDVSILATSQGKPSVFWFFGGIEETVWDEAVEKGTVEEVIPSNHSSKFAPAIHPTMRTGIDALAVAALTFLGRKETA